MNVGEFIKKFGENIPEGATICDPSVKPELFFEAPTKDLIAGAKAGMARVMYQSSPLSCVDITHGQLIYFPADFTPELNVSRNYMPMWDIYQTRNLSPTGRELITRYYRVETVFPKNYAGDPATIKRVVVYVDNDNPKN